MIPFTPLTIALGIVLVIVIVLLIILTLISKNQKTTQEIVRDVISRETVKPSSPDEEGGWNDAKDRDPEQPGWYIIQRPLTSDKLTQSKAYFHGGQWFILGPHGRSLVYPVRWRFQR